MEIRVRDPVHNFITLREKEAKLVGCGALQRLRGIRQLAMANLVYPGALHTRFDHTLGVTHVARLMSESLEFDKDEVQLVTYSALLHDIGHGPFSHVSENALERYGDRSKLPSNQKQEKLHEVVTAHMIRNEEQIVHILGKDTCDEVAKLLGTGHGQPALKSVVSGPLDADKQDYLLRDSRFCGVQYGVFDIHQMHRSLVLRGDTDEQELMIDPDGIHAIEQYVLAKYYLTTNVYRHRVRLITDQMIVRAIVLGVEKDENKVLHRLYAFDNSDTFVRNYLTWDDGRFMNEFAVNAPASQCKEMLDRLRERRLLKQVFSARVRDFAGEVRELLMQLSKPRHKALRARLESEIAKVLADAAGQPVPENFVIIHAFDIKSVRESSRNDEAGILVATDPPRPFTDESTLFASISEGYVDQFVEVYAPIEWTTPADRKKLKRTCRDPIKSAIESNCKSELKGAAK